MIPSFNAYRHTTSTLHLSYIRFKVMFSMCNFPVFPLIVARFQYIYYSAEEIFSFIPSNFKIYQIFNGCILYQNARCIYCLSVCCMYGDRVRSLSSHLFESIPIPFGFLLTHSSKCSSYSAH